VVKEPCMNLYLIRHAEAVELGTNGVSDDFDRPLTEKGHEQCRVVAVALQKQGVQFDQLVSSPLIRARETADAITQQWKTALPELKLCEYLSPGGKRRKLAKFLNALDVTSVGVVGHMPDLAEFAAWLMGSTKAELDFAKAGVALIVCDDAVSKGSGTLK